VILPFREEDRGTAFVDGADDVGEDQIVSGRIGCQLSIEGLNGEGGLLRNEAKLGLPDDEPGPERSAIS
jgi:hypothetical protein